MEEYLRLTLLSRPAEDQAEFAGRLSRFWTHMLRLRQADFEKVYAEATSFEKRHDRWSRQYLIEEDVLGVLEQELAAAGLEHDPIDCDDLYSRYEAVAPDWMQIEH